MVIYRNHDGEPVVNVPGTLWYNIVGTDKYEFSPAIHGEVWADDFNLSKVSETILVKANGTNSLETKQLVDETREYLSCVNRYMRDEDGNIVRFGNDVDKENNATLDMRFGIAVDMPSKYRSAVSIKENDWVPFSDGTWHKISRINEDNSVTLENGKIRDCAYLISETIKYLHDHLPENDESYNYIVNESVDHPSHYNHGGRETIDDIKEHLTGSEWDAYQGGLLFNVYKYIDRAPYKGKRLEDLKKAAWYLNKLIEEVGYND